MLMPVRTDTLYERIAVEAIGEALYDSVDYCLLNGLLVARMVVAAVARDKSAVSALASCSVHSRRCCIVVEVRARGFRRSVMSAPVGGSVMMNFVIFIG
ncbi:hypothetical protein GUITHDRAFT_115525 [Guillardia theta CCMP2712]|uniref:Uncharacterized protein n=1 Tax=Guillardia theta (strain CCMP2712) TaxID=905079 RepID=L1IRD3_GUITC|nr:hypothetical protein GUITHDRAFT_115525 [Guillardia theta CCMP2712]EKX38385.1 hypothetical protein GUITHDRAFT_115525 [Guillardia theta CCMP2712]|eukprot:XP_005825365.1 hypothetical protein GUITHDRAFT_115525 [Guillardia theta CCMP2712]